MIRVNLQFFIFISVSTNKNALAQISHTENVFIYFILNRYCIKKKCQKRAKDDDDESENSVFQKMLAGTPLLPPPPPILMGPCGVPQRRFEYQSEKVVSLLHYKYVNDNGSY